MPTYLYKREDGTQFEVFQRISESALEVCPATGQRVDRVISGGGGVIYKGSGWYVTDYKNSTPAASSTASKETVSPAAEPASSSNSCASGTCGHAGH